MIRFKSFDATAIAPNGVLFAGDLNEMQDLVAAVTDFTQNLSVATLAIGQSSLQLIRYGTSPLEARLTGALRTDGVLRGLGGIIAGAYTTTARNAITTGAGLQPYGMIILNTTTNRLEWNVGTDSSPSWLPLGLDGSQYLFASGTPKVPTAAVDTNTDQIASTAFVIGQGYLKSSAAATTYAPIASPIFTGLVTVAAGGIKFNDTTVQTTAATSGGGSGHFVGEPIWGWPSLSLPSFGSEVWGWQDGSAVLRSTYAALLAVLTNAQNGTRSNTSPIITALTSTAGLAVGMPVEGAGIPSGSTITSIDSSSQIHISHNATSGGTNTVTFFPHGNGDGSTTFNLPDARGRVPVGIALASGHIDVSGMANNEGVTLANRRIKHRHTNGTTVSGAPAIGSLAVSGAPGVGSLALPDHGHNTSDPGHAHTELGTHITVVQDADGASEYADIIVLNSNDTGGPGTQGAYTGLSVTDATSAPGISGAPAIGSLAVSGAPAIGSLAASGLIGNSSNDSLDAPSYLVLGAPLRMA